MQRSPELQVSEWFNTPTPLLISELRGRIVVLHAFQMLCPGCVLHGTPLAQRIHDRLASEVTVIGLHSVFEHHEAMRPASLAAYLREFGVSMPVGVDAYGVDDTTPLTMAAFAMQGTPTLIVLDHEGFIRHQYFGNVDELVLGVQIGRLLAEVRAAGSI